MIKNSALFGIISLDEKDTIGKKHAIIGYSINGMNISCPKMNGDVVTGFNTNIGAKCTCGELIKV